jgi:phosphatidylglycerophosphate synthase
MSLAPIDSALILTTTRIFNRPGEPSPASPLTVVGGLSLFQRTILTLQRVGISRFIVLAGAETEGLKRQLCADVRIRAEVRWLPVLEFSPGDPRSWEVFPGLFGASYLVVATGAVFPASLLARLRQEARVGEPLVVVRDALQRQSREALDPSKGIRTGSSKPAGGRSLEAGAPTVVQPSSAEGGVVTTLEAPATPTLDVDLVVIPEGFTASGWATPQDGPYPMHAALERAIRLGQARVLPLGSDWYQDVCAKGMTGPDEAERQLLRSLKGGLEGFVDRHFNRRCSRWITRWLVRTPLTPNGVTVLATAVGVLAAVAFGFGGYTGGIIGALLFQLSTILDCCDGEVARLKFMESAFGEQLDIGLDNVVHIALYAGIAWASYKDEWGAVALLLGGFAMLGNVAAFVVVQQATRLRKGLDPERRRHVESILNSLASRDFSVLILALALVGHVEWFLPLAAIGSNIFWPVLAWQLRPAKLPLPPAE